MHEGFSILLSIGGAVTLFFLGWRLLAWLQYKWWTVNKSKSPAAVVAAAVMAGGPSRTTLAQRQDIVEDQALTTHQEFEKYLDHLAELDREKEQREELIALAKVRRRGGANAIKEAWHDNRQVTAGPMTTFIQLSEQQLAAMKKAKAERDAAGPAVKGPNG